MRLTSRQPFSARMRSRSKLQLAAMGLIIVIEVVGMVLIARHDRHAGSSLIGLGIVALAPFIFWINRTSDYR